MWQSAWVSSLEAGTLKPLGMRATLCAAGFTPVLLGKNELSVPVIPATSRLDSVFQRDYLWARKQEILLLQGTSENFLSGHRNDCVDVSKITSLQSTGEESDSPWPMRRG